MDRAEIWLLRDQVKIRRRRHVYRWVGLGVGLCAVLSMVAMALLPLVA